MKQLPRLVVVASVLLAVGLAAHPAEAQLAYMASVRTHTCQVGETAPCNEAVVETVNTATGQIVRSIEAWRNRTGFVEVAVHPFGERLYVMTYPPADAASQETSFQVFNTSTWVEEASFTMPGRGTQLTFSRGGTRLLVTRTDLANVAVIDTTGHAVVDSIPATQPFTTLVGRDGRVFIAHANNRITVHDGGSFGLLQEIALPSPVFRMALSTGDSHVYGTSGSDLLDVDLATGGVSVIDWVGASEPRDVTYARGKVYVTAAPILSAGAAEGVSVIDPVTHAILTMIFFQDPFDVVASPDESRVVATGLERWMAIDTATDAARASGPGFVGSVAFAAPTPYTALFIDAPPTGAALRQPFAMSGWAVNVRGLGLEPGIETIHVWAHPVGGGTPRFVGVPTYGTARPDVAQLFGPRYLNAGYTMSVTGLPPGDYDLIAYGRSAWTPEWVVAASRRVRVLRPLLHLFVDTPVNGATIFPATGIAGWALDPASTSGSLVDAIHVWAYPASGGAPRFAGAATLRVRRPDVAAAFGPQFLEAGWILPGETSNLPPGQYTLVVYARHAIAGAFLAEQALRVTVRDPVPMMAVDVPAAGSTVSSPFRIAGWAIDYGVTTGTGVDGIHVWAASGGTFTFLGAADYGLYRPDVAAAFGERFGLSAFELNASLPPGTHTLLVFPHVMRLNAFGAARTVTVTVQ